MYPVADMEGWVLCCTVKNAGVWRLDRNESKYQIKFVTFDENCFIYIYIFVLDAPDQARFFFYKSLMIVKCLQYTSNFVLYFFKKFSCTY